MGEGDFFQEQGARRESKPPFMPSGGGGHTPLGRRGAQAIEIHDSTRNAAIGKKRRAFCPSATIGSFFLKTFKSPI